VEGSAHARRCVGEYVWVTQWFNPWDRYRLAREAFADIRRQAFARAEGRVVRFHVTGHSLGGGLAVHVARGFPCTAAVVFNTSCVTNQIRFNEPYKDNQVVDIRENRDLLTNTLCAPATLLGWNRNHQLYGAEWIRIRRRENATKWTWRSVSTPSAAWPSPWVARCSAARRTSAAARMHPARAGRVWLPASKAPSAFCATCGGGRRLRKSVEGGGTVTTTTKQGSFKERRRARFDSCDFSPIEQVDRQCRREC
jgi:pimeloyl-ACP methyl ester carboxylesterase